MPLGRLIDQPSAHGDATDLVAHLGDELVLDVNTH
jgi:hypothetical protein